MTDKTPRRRVRSVPVKVERRRVWELPPAMRNPRMERDTVGREESRKFVTANDALHPGFAAHVRELFAVFGAVLVTE